MIPELAPEQLKQTRPREYLARFAFGGAITAATGVVAAVWGPVVAGLFLAFPAILPASMTLVKQHDGRACAADHARGARLGSIGLAVFALVVTAGAGHLPAALVLLLAAAAWLATNLLLWFARYARPRTNRAGACARPERRASDRADRRRSAGARPRGRSAHLLERRRSRDPGPPRSRGAVLDRR